MNPVLEGNETFTVFLSSAIGSSLVQPYIASVVIHDSNLDGRFYNLQFACVEVLRPSQPNGIMSSAVSLPNHTFTGQA